MARCWERAGAPVGVPVVALVRCLTVSACIAVAALLTMAVAAGRATPAAAHARVTGSAPAAGAVMTTPPTEVSLVLDAKPATVEGDPLQVFAPDGRRVDTGGATVSDDARTLTVPLDPGLALPAGEYQLLYRVVSADTHVIAGRLTFSAEHAAPAMATTATASAIRPARTPRADQPPSGQAADAPRLAPGRPDDPRPRAVAGVAAGLAVLGIGWRLLRRRSRRRFEADLAPPPMPARRRAEPRLVHPGGSTGVSPPSSPAYRPGAAGTPGREMPQRSPAAGGGRRRPHARPEGTPRRPRAAR
jgi:methionine-rich copper-binding protein CopC